MQNIQLLDKDGHATLINGFIPADRAMRFYDILHDGLAWQTESIKLYGKTVPVPRLVCWYGNPGAVYQYSGVRHEPLPWTAELRQLKEAIEAFTGQAFNSVLGNLYRDGRDSMGWHADKEKELGRDPYIASLSLGATRLFRLQHNKRRETVETDLSAGSLLLMSGALQHHWRHCVPKTRQPVGGRINLTFRHILID
jgi:alkylated DNA repair dioxygenase AlkB